MKRIIALALALLCVLGAIGCRKAEEDVLHLGLNAEIIEIDAENLLLYVKGVDRESDEIFGGRTALDCSAAAETDKIIYVSYDEDVGNDPVIIQFSDLQVGDQLVLGIYESQLNSTDAMVVEQVQLGTQRLN